MSLNLTSMQGNGMWLPDPEWPDGAFRICRTSQVRTRSSISKSASTFALAAIRNRTRELRHRRRCQPGYYYHSSANNSISQISTAQISTALPATFERLMGTTKHVGHGNEDGPAVDHSIAMPPPSRVLLLLKTSRDG